jgi:hypothetical protein
MRSVPRQPSGGDHTVIHVVEAMPWRGPDMQRAAFMRWRNSAEFMTWTRDHRYLTAAHHATFRTKILEQSMMPKGCYAGMTIEARG